MLVLAVVVFIHLLGLAIFYDEDMNPMTSYYAQDGLDDYLDYDTYETPAQRMEELSDPGQCLRASSCNCTNLPYAR